MFFLMHACFYIRHAIEEKAYQYEYFAHFTRIILGFI